MSAHESIAPLNDSTLPPSKRVTTQSSTTNHHHHHQQQQQQRRPARRKVGVKRGFGLHDWNRLLKTARDPAQRKGQPYRKISPSEIRLHNDEFDAWISLHGKVYNITPYLHYHPGGVKILESCLGGDATALFEKYHRWVNIQGLIGPLLLGDLITDKKPSSSMKEQQFHFTMPAPRPPRRQPIPSLLDSPVRSNVTTATKTDILGSSSSINSHPFTNENDDEEIDLNPWDKATV